MRLLDLDPKITDGQLRFRCPACGEHWISIPVAAVESTTPLAWSAAGPLETLTVRPSIDAHAPPCRWHGFITNGEIITA